jgi:hypothetical protein
MRATTGKFGHSIVSVHRDDEALLAPHVVIELREWSRQSAAGAPVVSPDLASKADIDNFIAAMKADLDAIGSKAKRALANAQKRALTLVKS